MVILEPAADCVHHAAISCFVFGLRIEAHVIPTPHHAPAGTHLLDDTCTVTSSRTSSSLAQQMLLAAPLAVTPGARRP